MIAGYTGNILNIDLTHRTIVIERLSLIDAQRFVGTYGLGSLELFRRMKPHTDPLGSESVLGFVTGPLTGTGALFGGRFCVVHKSPVNQGWNDANCGGYFGPELKKAGFDAVYITGISDSPVYLWLHDGQVEIRDAGHLWGMDCSETETELREELDEPKASCAVIGPAGERLSWMAAIMNDHHRAAARGGPGAVMGSKKLKALVVRGSGQVPVANETLLRDIHRSIVTEMKNGPLSIYFKMWGETGTGTSTVQAVLRNDSPVKNWSGIGGVDFTADALDPKVQDRRYKTKRYACASCPLACGSEYQVNDGDWPVGKTFRPEYETSSAFGSMLMNNDPNVIIKCNDICNRYGIDTMSTGSTIAWAMECFDKGLITIGDTGGIELTWGNGPAIVQVTEAIARVEGFGQVLANGSSAAAKTLDRGYEYLQVVRGIEIPQHHPLVTPGYGRTYQADPTPGRHTKGGLWLEFLSPDKLYDFINTGELDRKNTCNLEFLSLAGACEFLGMFGMMDKLGPLVEAVTGWHFGEKEQQDIGMRSLHIRNAFNLREGILPEDSILPGRAGGYPAPEAGPLEGKQIDITRLVSNFYQAMEWDEITGMPDKESLIQLGGLEDVVRDIFME